MPASELLDAVVDAQALWGRGAVELGERVAAAGSPLAALALLQDGAARRLGGAPDPLVAEVVRRLLPGGGERVSPLAPALAISERQLRRRCVAATGLAPKALHRLLRFQGVLARVQSELARGCAPAPHGLARLAADAGYADQAHLTRECAGLTGMAPAAFLRETARWCGPDHDHAASLRPLLRGVAAA